jgi:hypothetical protein
MSSRVVDLAGLLQQIDTANSRMSAGDWGLWRELLSHREDVAILGAYGAQLTGWEAVSAVSVERRPDMPPAAAAGARTKTS